MLAIVAALTATAAEAGSPPSTQGQSWSLGGTGTFPRALTIGPEAKIWFAGLQLSPQAGEVGFAGSVGSSGPAAVPAAASLGERLTYGGIATGVDGNLWMTVPRANMVVRMSPSGDITKFPLPSSLNDPTAIVAAPEGTLWFTSEGSNAIGSISTVGTIRAYPLSANSTPRGITTGSEGTIWFTEAGANAVGRIAANGEISTFPLPVSGGQPNQIARGPEGNLWFTETGAPRVGRVTLQGEVSEFAAEPAGPIVAGPHGDLWFGSGQGIGSISPQGRLGMTYGVLGSPGNVESLAMGPEGALWYGAHMEAREGGGGNYLIHMTAPGVVGTYSAPAPTTTVAKNAKGRGTAWALVRVGCTGGAAEQSCGGTLRLKANGAQLAARKYALTTGGSRW
ncbi:MAG TPA: hypothetical protein VN671_11530, partial [Solirubrobacterales bacterium]|nr:hypothetical protein [Solirubrobacterales bacterium]